MWWSGKFSGAAVKILHGTAIIPVGLAFSKIQWAPEK
jgi:hypothetical protein